MNANNQGDTYMTLLTKGGLNRRRFLQTSAATAVAASLPLGGAIAAPKRGGHLRVGKAHGQTTDTLNPGTWENGFTIGMSFAVHGRLTEVIENPLPWPRTETQRSTPEFGQLYGRVSRSLRREA